MFEEQTSSNQPFPSPLEGIQHPNPQFTRDRQPTPTFKYVLDKPRHLTVRCLPLHRTPSSQSLPGCLPECPGSAVIAGPPPHRQASNTVCLHNEEEFAFEFSRSGQQRKEGAKEGREDKQTEAQKAKSRKPV